MAKFAGRRGDLTWGMYNYPVTRTQKQTLDGIMYMLGGYQTTVGYFCSQRPSNGEVIVGINHRSLSVHRSGRITSNQRSHRPIGEVFDRDQGGTVSS